MFDVWKSRKTDIEKIADEVSRRVFLILAFPRSLYENIPNSLIESDYVVGYHFMIALNCYIELSKEKTDVEVQGLVLAQALSAAFGIDGVEVSERLLPMIQNPSLEFERGASDANNAYAMILENNSDAFLEFNNNIRYLYH
jgi:hypothetical protein